MTRLPNPSGVRINRGRFVTMASSTVRDTRLSYRALGLLTYLLDQKEGWQVRSEQLTKGEGREGREAVRTALRELAAKGYYRLERRRLRDGKCAMGTAVSSTPVEQWVTDHKIFSSKKDPAVPVIEQDDGSFMIEYPDGTLGSDGFPPDPDDEEPADAPESAPDEEPATEDEPPATPARRPRRSSAQKAADDAEKQAAAQKKAEEKAALDKAAEAVAKWWWEDAEKHLGKYVGKTNGYIAMRSQVRKALSAGYTQRQCADALREARQHLPSAQQWQRALGIATNHITPTRPTGRVPYSDQGTWGTPDGATTDSPRDDSDDASFGVVSRQGA
ncbi:hypothetical protein [Streptomyces similanensis]|uniref:Helix-turn-helix domain-containing protein n=1 Tax=Streptomyces similanensis TaxID=1274988 RepID=A0ABP9L5T5_9ACTN